MFLRNTTSLTILAILLTTGAILILIQHSSVSSRRRLSQISNKFWRNEEQNIELPTIQEVRRTTVNKSKEAPPVIVKKALRVVHLDLKGAAPKITYLEQILPLFSALGANAILLEYEDMFPYEGDFQTIRSPHAYSIKDIETIKKLAKLSNLEVIPLVQVFGHLEFVLKHEKFSHLREVEAFPNSLNPHAPGALELVTDLAFQVLNLHPEAQWFHIGADEVFSLGDGQDSKNWLHNNKGDIRKLFLSHVTAVGTLIKKRRPEIQLIMWDDMMRNINPATLKESQIQHLASPMIWMYNPNFNTKNIENLISKYQNAGFRTVWFASTFKGASGVEQQLPPLQNNLKNTQSWQKVISSMKKYPFIYYQGIVLTGWQRYDHFTVLCELLPVAIPSLALCLQTLKHGSFTDEARREIQHYLGCSVQLEKGICEGRCSFTGSELYNMVSHIHSQLQTEINGFLKSTETRGVFTSYHRKYNYANPRHLGTFKQKLKQLLNNWETYLQIFRTNMEAIYFQDTVEEWMDEYVNPYMDPLRTMHSDLERIIALNGRPKTSRTV